MKRCPQCGATLVQGSCEYCGYKAEPEPEAKASAINITINQVASEPNRVIHEHHYYAPAKTQTYSVALVSEKKRWVAFALSLFGGFFGAHQFYVGNFGKGVLYLFTAGLLGFGWIIDTISIGFGRFKDRYGLPLKK